ncbi:MAG TPA: hypothetical protein ACFYD3_10585 [Candidatus Hypogeohydataceae bacterium YC41]
MLHTLNIYVHLINWYFAVPIIIFLALLGYLLRWWYQVSYKMYCASVVTVAFFFGVGCLAVMKYGYSPYTVGVIYAIILVGYLTTCKYHISWKDLMGKFFGRLSTPKTT